ncbi:MAG: GerMN domain-containing protein [Ilumatobacteraceae bacterium]
MRVRCVPLLLALVGIGTACSVSSEDSAVRVPADQIPFQLANQSTTTTTDVASATSIAPSDDVEVYFVRDDRLAVVERDAVASDPQGLLSLLALGPSAAESAAGLRSALVPDLASIVGIGERVLTVDLAAGFTELAPTEQRLALAQITFSVTQLPAIAEVRFLVAGQAASVPRGDGSSTDRPVTAQDYQELAPR